LSGSLNPKWQIYTENIRQTALLYRYYGLKGLVNILKVGYEKGRGVVKEIERKLIKGCYQNIGLDSGQFDPELNKFLNFL